MLSQNSQTDKIKEFWVWFDENKSHYTSEEDEWDPDLSLLQEKIEAIQIGLRIEIELEREKNSLIISASGFIEIFPLVKEMAALAPEIEGWEIVTFRKSLGDDFIIENEHYSFHSSELSFWPYWEEGSLDIVLYASDINGIDQEILLYDARQIVIFCIGEYDTATKIRYCFFHDIEDADLDAIQPLTELKHYIDLHFNNNN